MNEWMKDAYIIEPSGAQSFFYSFEIAESIHKKKEAKREKKKRLRKKMWK